MKKIVWPTLIFIVAWVLGAYFGIPLKSVVTPVYDLLPGMIWIVIGLLFIVAFLLSLVEGARRYYSRTVSEIFEKTDEVMADYKIHSARIEKLTLLEGQSLSLYLLLENRTWADCSGPPLLRDEVRYHEAELWNTMQDYYGSEHAGTYFKKLGDIPDALVPQRNRMESHYATLERHIKSVDNLRLLATQKADDQKSIISNRLNPGTQDSLQKVGSIPSSKVD